VTKDAISHISETEEISGIIIDEGGTGGRRVTITVYGNGVYYSAHYFLHPKGDLGDAPQPEGYEFHLTEEIYSHDLYFMRLRVKEEAERRGLPHIRLLGF